MTPKQMPGKRDKSTNQINLLSRIAPWLYFTTERHLNQIHGPKTRKPTGRLHTCPNSLSSITRNIIHILRGTKGKNHPLSLFSFFHRMALERRKPFRKRRNSFAKRRIFSKYRWSFCPLSPQHNTLNNIGPDGGHRNVFSAPPFKRRKWKPV